MVSGRTRRDGGSAPGRQARVVRRQLAVRAAIVVALTAGFYALVLATVAALLVVPPYLTLYLDKPPFAFTWLFAYPAAWWIVKAAMAPTGPGTPVGVHAGREDQPRLRDLIDEVAARVGEPGPDEVRLTWGDDAAVYEERGILWPRHGPKVMILGLGLLASVTTYQLRSIVAHELAHYGAGDTRMGQLGRHMWLRFDRVVDRLYDHVLPLRLPFVWYAKLVQRITARVERDEETVADAVAVAAYGQAAARDALRGGHTAAIFDGYWESEVATVLDAGFLPPIVAGFESLLGEERTQRSAAASWEFLLANERPNPYSRHPVTSTRWSHPSDVAGEGPAAERSPAVRLIADVGGIERALLRATESGERVASLRPITWAQVGEKVLVPSWEGHLARVHPDAGEWVLGDLPRLVTSGKPAPADEAPEEAPPPAVMSLGALACCALARAGWAVDARPGADVVVSSDGHELRPFRAVAELWSGERTEGAWHEFCQAAAVAELSMAGTPSAAAHRPSSVPPPHRPPAARQAPSLELTVTDDRKAKVPTVVGVTFVAGMGFLIAIGVAAVPFTGGVPLAGVVFCIAVSAGLIAMLLWFVLVHAKSVLRPGRVRVEGDVVTVDHPGVFKEPLRVRAGEIRLLTIDDGDGEVRKDRRFPVRGGSWGYAEGPDAELGWLWTKADGSIVPYLGVRAGRPNGALLFEAPVRAPAVRRESDHGPLKGEALSGLLVTFDDPGLAAHALTRTCAVRQVTAADAERLERAFSGD